MCADYLPQSDLKLTSVAHSLPVIKFCLLVNLFHKVQGATKFHRSSLTSPGPTSWQHAGAPLGRPRGPAGVHQPQAPERAIAGPLRCTPRTREIPKLENYGDYEVSVHGGEGYSANDSTHFQSVMVKRSVVSHLLKSSLHRRQISRANAARDMAGQVLIETRVYW